jgi:hypothetical protein
LSIDVPLSSLPHAIVDAAEECEGVQVAPPIRQPAFEKVTASLDAKALSVLVLRYGITFASGTVSGPLSTTSFALRNPRLIRIEIRLRQRAHASKLRYLLVIEIVRGGMDAINLSQRDLIVVERLCNTATLVEQPIRPTPFAEHDLLDCRGFRPGCAPVSIGCALHQHTLRTQDNAIGVDDETSTCRPTPMQSPHINQYFAEPHVSWSPLAAPPRGENI